MVLGFDAARMDAIERDCFQSPREGDRRLQNFSSYAGHATEVVLRVVVVVVMVTVIVVSW